MIQANRMNGDFYFNQVDLNWLILSFVLSLIPYYIYFNYLKKKTSSKYFAIFEIKHIEKIAILLLILNIFFSIYYKVGLYAQSDIYNVPIYIKPLIVIVNKIDMYILVGCLILTKKFSSRINFTLILLLLVLSLSRASIFVFLFLTLIFIGNGVFKINYKQLFLLSIIGVLSFGYISRLYDFRDNLRNVGTTQSSNLIESSNVQDFVKARIIGRISSLSSITYFYQNSKYLRNSINEIGAFDYIIEFFRPFYGGFFRENKIGYTYYLTNFFDDKADVNYGIMYGIPTVLMISLFKGFHVLLLNFIFILIIISFIIKLCAYLFGNKYKEFSFVILYYPMMSGVSSEFGQIFLFLLILSLTKLLYISFGRRKKYINHENMHLHDLQIN